MDAKMQTLNIPSVSATLMSPAEAREAVCEVKERLQFIRSKLLELHERKGYQVLGYATWKEFCQEEFSSDRRRINYSLQAAVVEGELVESGIDKGKIFPTPDSHLRAIGKAPSALRKEAFTKLKEWESEGRVSEADAQLAVAAVYPNVRHEIAEQLVKGFQESGESIPKRNRVDYLFEWAKKNGISLGRRHREVLSESIEVSLQKVAQSILESSSVKKDNSLEIASFLASYSPQEVANGLTAMGQEYWLKVVLLLLPQIDVKEVDKSQIQSTADAFYTVGEALDQML